MSKEQFRLGVMKLMQESVLVQGVITLTLVGTLSYMYINSMVVPGELLNILYIILGFYFAGKMRVQANRKVKDYENDVSNNTDRRHPTGRRGQDR